MGDWQTGVQGGTKQEGKKKKTSKQLAIITIDAATKYKMSTNTECSWEQSWVQVPKSLGQGWAINEKKNVSKGQNDKPELCKRAEPTINWT